MITLSISLLFLCNIIYAHGSGVLEEYGIYSFIISLVLGVLFYMKTLGEVFKEKSITKRKKIIWCICLVPLKIVVVAVLWIIIIIIIVFVIYLS